MKTDKRNALKTVLRIVKDTKPIAHWLALSAIISLISVLLSMYAPELLGKLTDEIYDRINLGLAIDKDGFLGRIMLLLAVYALSAIMSAITTYVMNYSVSRHFTCRIRIQMSEKIGKIPVKTVDNTPTGDIIARMTNDVSIMGGSVHDIFGIIINGIIKLCVITTVIFISNAVMAAVLVVFVPLSIILSAILASKSEKHFNESRAVAGKIYSLCEETLTGFDTVKVFSLEESRNATYRETVDDYSKKAKKGFVTSGVVQPIVTFVNNIAYIAICLIGGYLAVSGKISAGDLVAFIMYTKLFSGPLESIAGGMSMLQSTVAAAGRVYGFIDGEEMDEYVYESEKSDSRGAVRFEKVAFSYSPDKPLIEDFNLTVTPGQKIAIVGPTGSGKTTIVNLLMRFYDVTGGRITIDGEDIKELPRAEVRNKFGMVLQDTKLFSGTVFENIAYGNPNATEQEVINAAKEAHIDLFINSLPDGYNTKINEDSTNISQGQKQLLTIARAYLANRPILILDEATSNVDTRTELLIQSTMDELMMGRTAFVIAHRLSTIENADIILVVNNGKIEEEGTHGELLEKGGLYAEMYRSQYSV